MWTDLPEKGKNEYKKLILAFASLTEMFAQKAFDDEQIAAPIINSKYQETAFQRAFNASAEDIGNTSYDVAVQYNGEKYLVGIKTFGIASGDQKVAQFKAKHDEWARIIDQIKSNSVGIDNKEDVDRINANLYMELARKIAHIRNERIDSSYANIRGFKVDIADEKVHSVYHVLMPSSKGELPKIYVGETSYDKINIDNISIGGCTGKSNPTNFIFSDGNHTYKYTAADSQLHMSFSNRDIVCDEWDVKYADDAHAIFEHIADIVYPETASNPEIHIEHEARKVRRAPIESYCWTIWNKNKEVELYSGFNSFFGTGSKMGKEQRVQRIAKIYTSYEESVDVEVLSKIKAGISSYLLESASSADEKASKARLREYIIKMAQMTNNNDLLNELKHILFRPMDEMYIPIPDSTKFHNLHPNFFGENFGKTIPGTSKLELPKEQRVFNLIFEPSGDSLPVYITQDNGKAIESAEKQTYLGEWILRGIFQLAEHEPLTSDKLYELNINGLRFFKYEDSEDIHIEFVWIDEENPPEGFIQRS